MGFDLLKESIKSSKIVIEALKTSIPNSSKNKEKALDKLIREFCNASAKNNDLKYCLACSFDIWSGNSAFKFKKINGNYQVIGDEPTQDSLNKAELAIKDIVEKGFNQSFLPTDLYIESPNI